MAEKKVSTIKITSADSNDKEIQRSYSYANPAASNYVLKSFAQQLQSLSKNTLKKVERVDVTDITAATEE